MDRWNIVFACVCVCVCVHACTHVYKCSASLKISGAVKGETDGM